MKEYKFHIKLPAILSDALDRATDGGITKTDILRASLIEYLRKNKF